MANQPSENSIRITYVEDRDVYAELQAIAKERGASVGKLIRDAVAAHYGLNGERIKMRPTNWVEPEAETKSSGRTSKKK